MDEDDFNSSDIEIPVAQANPHAHRGQQSIEAFIASAFQDRTASKIQSKTLQQIDGSIGTRMARELWANRFDAFRTHTLRKSVAQIPTAEDIERFLFTVPTKIHGKNRDPVAYSYLKAALRLLIAVLKFRHHEFRLDATDGIRLASVFATLKEQNLITKDPTREKLWITSTLVRRIVTAIVSDAMENGTRSWDVTCSKVLSIILQAALCSRAGDIARSKHYTGSEYLQWQHVRIKLKRRHDGTIGWHALIELRYLKGYKDDASKNHKVQLQSLTGSDGFIMCPVTWLIVLALRTGAVEQTSIEDLQSATDATYNKTIIWQFPERPVVCAFRAFGCMLDLEQPATNMQLLKSLRQGCDLIGMLQSVVTHDLRHGAAAELAHMPGDLPGASTVGAARMLSHTDSVRDQGITADYVGHVREDTWKKRLHAEFEDEFGPETVARPFVKSTRQKSSAIDAIAIEHGLDPGVTKERTKARQIGQKRLRDEWIRDSQITPSEDNIFSARSAEAGRDEAEDDTDNIDPRLRAIDQIITGGTNDVEFMSTATSLLPGDADYMPTGDRLPSDHTEFVTKFSRINVVRNEVAGSVKPVGAVEGGSRDAVSRYLYKCINAPDCTRTFQTHHLRDTHGKVCDPSAKVVHPFACAEDSCESTFPTQTGLNTHMQYVHGTWTPQGCNEPGCDSQEVFQNRGQFLLHRQSYHSDWTPRVCSVCSEHFEQRRAFVAHIKKYHPERMEELMPPKTKKRKRASLPETVNWVTSQCAFPGCKSDYAFDARSKYVQHLRIMHKIRAADVEPYMPKMQQSS